MSLRFTLAPFCKRISHISSWPNGNIQNHHLIITNWVYFIHWRTECCCRMKGYPAILIIEIHIDVRVILNWWFYNIFEAENNCNIECWECCILIIVTFGFGVQICRINCWLGDLWTLLTLFKNRSQHEHWKNKQIKIWISTNYTLTFGHLNRSFNRWSEIFWKLVQPKKNTKQKTYTFCPWAARNWKKYKNQSIGSILFRKFVKFQSDHKIYPSKFQPSELRKSNSRFSFYAFDPEEFVTTTIRWFLSLNINWTETKNDCLLLYQRNANVADRRKIPKSLGEERKQK